MSGVVMGRYVQMLQIHRYSIQSRMMGLATSGATGAVAVADGLDQATDFQLWLAGRTSSI